MLEQFWARQYQFQLNFFNPQTLTPEEKIKWTKEFILCAHQELAEIMNSIDWKSYHLYDKSYSIENTQEEIIDTLKFVLNLCIVWNIKPADIEHAFNRKSDEVERRFKVKQSCATK